jgi:hypothetical protein
MQHVEETLPVGELQRIVDGIVSRQVDPYSAAADIVRRVAAHLAAPVDAGGLGAPAHHRTEP